MHLKEVEITNFRCFEHLKMDFHPRMTVIVGANGAGKTALLEAIAAGLPTGSIRVSGADRRFSFASSAAHLSPVDGIRIRATYLADSGETFDTFVNGSNVLTNTALYPDVKETDFVCKYWDIKRGGMFGEIAPEQLRRWFEVEESDFLARLQDWEQLPPNAPRPARPDRSERALDVTLRLTAFVPNAMSVRYSFRSKDVELTVYNEKKQTIDTTPFSALSSGYRSLLSVVAGLAVESLQAEPNFVVELWEGVPGTILIDEIDLHLHPAWQRTVLQGLLNAFPKMQFIVTTHSPQIVASAQADWVRILDRDGSVTRPTDQTYGADSNRILEDIFGVDSRPTDVAARIDAVAKLLDEERFNEALAAIHELQAIVGVHDSAVNGLLWQLNLAGGADAQDHEE